MFKPGDRVRCIKPNGGYLKQGEIYTVTEYYKEADNETFVKLIKDGVATGGYYAYRFELVSGVYLSNQGTEAWL